MIKKIVFLGLACLCLPAILEAAEIGSPSAQLTVTDYGNHWRALSVNYSTSVSVIVSSKPANSKLGISEWRHREIVNTSDGLLMLMPIQLSTSLVQSRYDFFSTTYSVVLGSDTSGLNGTFGDSWVVPSSVDEVWGLWSSSTTKNGAGGSESWNKK